MMLKKLKSIDWLMMVAVAVTTGYLSGAANATADTCVQFYPGLCPGPSSCMCTDFRPCNASASEPPAHLVNSDGTCSGSCRQALAGGCASGGLFCYPEIGPCSIPTPSPLAPLPSTTPSPIAPSLVGMVKIPTRAGTWIDAFEASVEYESSPGVWLLHPFNYNVDPLDANGTPYRAVSPRALSAAAKPQAYISQVQGAKACAAAGKRLCTLAEYMAACSANESVYPYGNEYHHGYCNEGNENPILIIYGQHATWNLTEMNNPILDTLPHTLVPSGTFSNCTNPHTQTFDMSGNLDEWVADITEEGHGIFKGGYFVDASINGNGCLYETVAHAPTYHDYSLGFRCCFSVA